MGNLNGNSLIGKSEVAFLDDWPIIIVAEITQKQKEDISVANQFFPEDSPAWYTRQRTVTGDDGADDAVLEADEEEPPCHRPPSGPGLLQVIGWDDSLPGMAPPTDQAAPRASSPSDCRSTLASMGRASSPFRGRAATPSTCRAASPSTCRATTPSTCRAESPPPVGRKAVVDVAKFFS